MFNKYSMNEWMNFYKVEALGDWASWPNQAFSPCEDLVAVSWVAPEHPAFSLEKPDLNNLLFQSFPFLLSISWVLPTATFLNPEFNRTDYRPRSVLAPCVPLDKHSAAPKWSNIYSKSSTKLQWYLVHEHMCPFQTPSSRSLVIALEMYILFIKIPKDHLV